MTNNGFGDNDVSEVERAAQQLEDCLNRAKAMRMESQKPLKSAYIVNATLVMALLATVMGVIDPVKALLPITLASTVFAALFFRSARRAKHNMNVQLVRAEAIQARILKLMEHTPDKRSDKE